MQAFTAGALFNHSETAVELIFSSLKKFTWEESHSEVN
jgi:hypothetical protein